MMRNLLLFTLGLSLASAGLAAAQPVAVLPAVPAQQEGEAIPPAACAPATTGIFPAALGPVVEEGGRLSIRADYLLWTVKSPSIPPLLTTSSDPAGRGVLGRPNTGTLAGGGDTYLGLFSGGRLFADYALADGWGVQVGGFLLEQKSRSFGVQSNAAGSPAIGVPFQSAFNGLEQANLVASPGALAGGATTRFTTLLWGAEANVTALAVDSDGLRVNVLGGFRHANLHEQLRLDTNSTLLAANGLFDGTLVGPGTSFNAFDQFGTRNAFYGGQLGVNAGFEYGIFSLEAFGKLALGVSHELASIAGGTTALTPGGVLSSAPGGTFAQTSNIGRLSADRFAVLPEAGINLGVHVTDRITAFAGYQCMYWSDVVRPGDQVNRVVNRNLIPVMDDGTRLGPQMPSATALRHTDFWAQGVNFGVNLSW